jgi:predicted DNA-binding antitoxin AbrB/MazE fold protein
MIEMTTAIYESGTLRLLKSLNLPEHAQVRVQVEPVTDEQLADELDRARAQLRRSGLMAGMPDSVQRRARSISEAERTRLANVLAAAGPLSDVIIAERDAR